MELKNDMNISDYQLLSSGYTLIQNITEEEAVSYAGMFGDFIYQNKSIKHVVKWTEGFDNYAYSKSKNLIGPHTEYPYLKNPPKYQALYCRKKAEGVGGETYLSNSFYFLDSLNVEEKELLKKTIVNFLSGEALVGADNVDAHQPIYEETEDESVLRFSHNLFIYGDVNAELKDVKQKEITFFDDEKVNSLMNKLLEYMKRNHVSIHIPDNSLLIWNNHKVLHWRNQYEDKRRELVRLLIK